MADSTGGTAGTPGGAEGARGRPGCGRLGGLCHLLSYAPHEGWEPGDVVAYRCEDCLDRWDIVLEEEDNDPYG